MFFDHFVQTFIKFLNTLKIEQTDSVIFNLEFKEKLKTKNYLIVLSKIIFIDDQTNREIRFKICLY